MSVNPLTKGLGKGRFLNVIVMILFIMVVPPFFQNIFRGSILTTLLFTVMLISIVHSVSGNRLHLGISSLLAIPMLVASWAKEIQHIPLWISFFGLTCGVLLLAYISVMMLMFIFQQDEIGRDVIHAAIVLYLLMGVLWSFLYLAVDTISPGAFTLPANHPEDSRITFLYYSFVTLTTLGYGDIIPLSDQARALAMLEAVLGQIYLVVQVAWLVGMHTSRSHERKSANRRVPDIESEKKRAP